MDKNNIYKIGELAIDNLIDINELIYYKQVKLISKSANLVFFDAERIFCNYHFISYISKSLNYEVSHFMKKVDEHMSILDLDENKLFDKAYENNTIESNATIDTFCDYILDYKLFCAYKSLTDYQKRIIYLAFFLDLNDLQIAKKLNVSRQSISKTRKIALTSIKKIMEVA